MGPDRRGGGMTARAGRGRLVAGLVLALVAMTAASAAAAPHVKAMKLHLDGSKPGPNYTVEVQVKARICGKQGPMRLAILEQKTGFDRPATVTAQNSRSFTRRQHKPCQVYTPSWQLDDEFFGIGVYRVHLHAIDHDGDRSRSAQRVVRTYD
jgi:hypothetical protein